MVRHSDMQLVWVFRSHTTVQRASRPASLRPSQSPQLMDSEHAAALFPPDVIARAKEYLKNIPGGVGAYSESKGAAHLRKEVAKGIERRDGLPCDPNDLWLTDGASPGVHMLSTLLLRNEKDAILTPIPQYPLYSAAIALHGWCRQLDRL